MTPVKTTKKQAKQRKKDLDSKVVKALSHPLRMRILSRLNEGAASPNMLAKEFDESLPLVSYHVRILRDLDCIELLKTVPSRGSVEHYYRALTLPMLDDDDWAQVPHSARSAISGTVLERALGDLREALRTGSFDSREDRRLSFVPLVLDQQGWEELSARLGAIVDWAIDEQEASAKRLKNGESGGGEVVTRMMLASYEAPMTAPRTFPD